MLGSQITVGRIILALIATVLIGFGLNTLDSNRVRGFPSPAFGPGLEVRATVVAGPLSVKLRRSGLCDCGETCSRFSILFGSISWSR